MATANPITANRYKFLWQCSTVIANDLLRDMNEAEGDAKARLLDQFNDMADVYTVLERLALDDSSVELPDRPEVFDGFMPINDETDARIREILALTELE
jgi:hypothetical protein